MVDSNEHEQIIAKSTELLADDPDNIDELLERAKAYAKKRRFEAAIADLNRVIEIQDDHSKAYYNRGWVYKAIKDYPSAIADFTNALTSHPPIQIRGYSFCNRGLCYYLTGDFEEAISDLDKAIQMNPRDSEAYGTRGLARQMLGQHDEAMADYHSAIRIDPTSAIAHHNRGNARVNAEEFRRAIADFTRSLQLDPDNPKTHTSRGVAWRRKGRYSKALADYERALELDPENPLRYFVLGGFLAVCPNARFRDGARAVELMTKCCELAEIANAEYLNILAAAYAESGDFSTAMETLRRSLEVATADDDQRDALFCLELYERGEPWRMDPPTWRQRFA